MDQKFLELELSFLTDTQFFAGETDTVDDSLILTATGFLAAVCSGVEFHFDVKAFHIRVCFDDLIGFPHGDIACSGRNPGDAAAILIKDNAVVGKMIGEGYGCQLCLLYTSDAADDVSTV